MGKRLSQSELRKKDDLAHRVFERSSVKFGKPAEGRAAALSALREGARYGGYMGLHLKRVLEDFSSEHPEKGFAALERFAASKRRRPYAKTAIPAYVDLLLSHEPASTDEHYRLLREEKSVYSPLFLYLLARYKVS